MFGVYWVAMTGIPNKNRWVRFFYYICMKKSAELLVKLISNRTFIYDKELGVHFLSLPFIVIGEQKKRNTRQGT